MKKGWMRRAKLALATGAAAMAFTVSCDPYYGIYIDRYDDDWCCYEDDWYFDLGYWDTGWYYEDVGYYDDWYW